MSEFQRVKAAIDAGLGYLEGLIQIKTWSFSADLCSVDRKIFSSIPENKHTHNPEIFTHFIALDLLGNQFSNLALLELKLSLVPSPLSTINYFVDASVPDFPDDADTTALGYTSLLKANFVKREDVMPMAQELFDNVNSNGLVKIYFKDSEKHRREMICPITCSNVLRLSYLLGLEGKLEKTENYVFNWLASGDYKKGSLYYPGGYPFLYFCSTFAMANSKVQDRFRPVLLSALENSLEDCKLPLDYALTLLALENLGCHDHSDAISRELLQHQEPDGSWPPDAVWGNTHGVFYGGKAVSTIFILGALSSYMTYF
ncbi:unnamed protein product [Allacma fusca]|uniref:Squalene cyclase C-terminal domain-containing protein n=1 Tax=Allacma fusca TaxID=39272 RepID=A0A8J2KCM9_9HEXA|nr:unnamed protein product [Allacma fusca]